jgi:hypothetical protein
MNDTQLVSTKTLSISDTSTHSRIVWSIWPYFPLIVALLLALLVRAILIIHAGGVMDGDESLVGIQAEHILRGERPVYFYGQANMGSLEAYLIACLFAIFGPSVWALRAEPTLLSLVIVGITWKFADVLACYAQLSQRQQYYFRVSATLFAAVSPLYDTVLELRTLGGYIETFVLMILLLLSALSLTQCWYRSAPLKDFAWRWAGIGAILGLGFWINPLLISAVFAAAIWMIGSCLLFILRWHNYADSLKQAILFILRSFLTAVAAMPTFILGAWPALVYGVTHNWLNITTMIGRAGQPMPGVHTMLGKLYLQCVGPRVVSGALPSENATSAALHALPLYVGVTCIAACGGLAAISLFWRQQYLVQIRRLTLLPLLFGVATALFFLIGWPKPVLCSDRDVAGRYATPLMLVLPIFLAAMMVFTDIFLQKIAVKFSEKRSNNSKLAGSKHSNSFTVLSLCLVALQATLLLTQAISYPLAHPGLTFQTPFCRDAPANNDQIITYMRREHIQYAWANFWIGNPIIFKTQEQLIVADPYAVAQLGDLARAGKISMNDGAAIHAYLVKRDRMPQYLEAVLYANRPSMFSLVRHNDLHPSLLRYLDAQHVTYRSVRFPSEPEMDIMLVTPLSRTVSPAESVALRQLNFSDCPTHIGPDYQASDSLEAGWGLTL